VSSLPLFIAFCDAFSGPENGAPDILANADDKSGITYLCLVI
jgi:hypothetical protein